MCCLFLVPCPRKYQKNSGKNLQLPVIKEKRSRHQYSRKKRKILSQDCVILHIRCHFLVIHCFDFRCETNFIMRTRVFVNHHSSHPNTERVLQSSPSCPVISNAKRVSRQHTMSCLNHFQRNSVIQNSNIHVSQNRLY